MLNMTLIIAVALKPYKVRYYSYWCCHVVHYIEQVYVLN